MNVFVDVLLSLLSSSVRLTRDTVKAAFRCFAVDCTPEAIDVRFGHFEGFHCSQILISVLLASLALILTDVAVMTIAVGLVFIKTRHGLWAQCCSAHVLISSLAQT